MVRTTSNANHTTIKYEEFKACDFSADATAISRYRSPDGLNMISDQGGNPIKRNGWKTIGLNSNTGGSAFTSMSPISDHQILCIMQPAAPNEFARVAVFNTTSDTFTNQATYLFSATKKEAIFKVKDTTYVLMPQDYSKSAASANSYRGGLYAVNSTGMKRIAFQNIDTTTYGEETIYTTKKAHIMCSDLNAGGWEQQTIYGTIDDIYPYVPTIVEGKQWIDNNWSGGVVKDSYNLLTPRVKETFFFDDSIPEPVTGTEFLLSNVPDIAEHTSGYLKAYDTVNLTASGEPTELAVTHITGSPWVRVTTTGITEISTDVPQITIEYDYSRKADDLFNCDLVQTLAEGASQRWWFASSNGSNKIFYSALGDPLYIPDNNYVTVGTDGVKIMGLLPVGNSLGVIKENNMNESTLWYVTATTITENTTVVVDTETSTTSEVKYVYKVENGVSDVGGIAPKTFRTLADEPLYLSSQGIVAITSKNTSSEKVVRKRSMYLDGKLLKEANLENAVACVWNGYYVLAINGHMYLLDSRQKTSDNRGNTSFNYEGYYWDNCPITAMCVLNGKLYFSNGERSNIARRLHVFTDNSYQDVDEYYQFNIHGLIPVTVNTPVDAVWSTCDDDDNLPQYRKTATKKGSYVVVAPYSVTGFAMSAIIDGGGLELAQTTGNILFTEVQDSDVYTWSGDFTDIDFSNFTFYVANGGVYVPFTKKIKKYRSLKLVFENDENQPFGLYKIVKTVEYSQYAR